MNSRKAHFRVGDTVTIFGDDNTMYLVTEVYTHSDKSNPNRKTFSYELTKILPSSIVPKVSNRKQEELILYAEYETRIWNTTMSFVKKDRAANGIVDKTGRLPFLDTVSRYYEKNSGSTEVQALDPEDLLDLVDRHEKAKDVDELLDALSDFNHVLAMFEGHPREDRYNKIVLAKGKVLSKLKRISKRG